MCPRCGRRSVEGHGDGWFALAVVGVLCPQEGAGACCCALDAAGALWPQEGVGRNTGNHRGGPHNSGFIIFL